MDEPEAQDALFDLLEGTDPPLPWARIAGVALLAAGLVALLWAAALLLQTTSSNVPSQSPVPLPHPLELFGAFALALTLLCGGSLAISLQGGGRAH